eukprot:10303837-Ditylum_brightwellii.AAC.1
MLLKCAAGHLCGMPTIVLNNPDQHHCMQCGEPMHGNLCSKLYCEYILNDNSPISINEKDIGERARG